MATIEERAKAFIQNLKIECDKFGKEADVFIDGAREIFEAVYIKGATEQQKIDIDKACNYIMTHSTYSVQPEVYAEGLKKAMEEQR